MTSYVPARVGLAWSLYYQGKKGQALHELKSVRWWAEQQNKYPIGAALHHLGRYYRLEGELDQAISCFEQAIEDSPEPYGNYWELGLALLAQGRHSEALTALAAARERLSANKSETAGAELEELIASVESRLYS